MKDWERERSRKRRRGGEKDEGETFGMLKKIKKREKEQGEESG